MHYSSDTTNALGSKLFYMGEGESLVFVGKDGKIVCTKTKYGCTEVNTGSPWGPAIEVNGYSAAQRVFNLVGDKEISRVLNKNS